MMMAEAVLPEIASAIILGTSVSVKRVLAKSAVSVPANGYAHMRGGGAQMDASTDDTGSPERNSGRRKDTTNYQGMPTCE
jgi:hypothetical protein